MPAIARLARLCPAGDALCWIKAVYSKLKGLAGLRTPRHTGGPSWRPPITGATSTFHLCWATASAAGDAS